MKPDPYDPHAFRRVADEILGVAERVLAAGEDGPVGPAESHAELAARFEEPLPRAGRPAAEVLARLERDVAAGARRLAHPLCVGHQVAPPLPASASADVLVSVLNNGLAVREMSPTATPLEVRVLGWFAELLGWSGEPPWGGTFVSGGSAGNLTALAAARAAVLPDAWEEGVAGARAAIVAGESAHYSVERAAGLLGIGRRGIARAEERGGRIVPSAAAAAIRRARAEGRTVVALVASAGTTPTGEVDDLPALARVARDEDVWLHVDAAHAGAFLLSERLRPLLDGLGEARSVAIDLHKTMLQPISTAMLLVRDRARLASAFAQDAPYIFHEESRAIDLGPLALQCSRRADAVRAWLSLQLLGADGIARLQEGLVDLARAAAERVAARTRFEVLNRPPRTNVLCFRHVPAELAADPRALDRHNASLRGRLNATGRAYVTGATAEERTWLRAVFMNPRTELRHVELLLDVLEELAEPRADFEPVP